MKSKILVRWLVKESGSIRGEAVSGLPQHLRRKVIRIDKRCFGFSPKHQEVTEVEIVEDLNPHSLEGTIFARPIFDRPHNALSREEAIHKMAELLGSEPRGSRDTYIEVNLMGWRGAITFAICKEAGPLTVHWVYHAADGKEQIAIPGITTILTAAAIHDHGVNRIVDWRRALQDLGEPYEVEVHHPKGFVVRWPGISTEMSEVVALVGGARLDRIHLEQAQVVADLTIVAANGTRSIVLGEGERLDGAVVRYATTRDEYVIHLNAADRQRVTTLLKGTRHSLEWHHEQALRELVEEDLPGTMIWEEIDKLLLLLKGFGTLAVISESMRNLNQLREAIDDRLTMTLVFTGEKDPRLYGADEVLEPNLSTLRARNAYELTELDEAISELRGLMDDVLSIRKASGYRDRVVAEADHVVAVAASSKVVGVDRVVANVRFKAERAKVYARNGHIENALKTLDEAIALLPLHK